MIAAAVMHMSATLKTGQYGNSRKSMTWPRSTPGGRNNRSVRFPATPAHNSPMATAQAGWPIRGTNLMITKSRTAIAADCEDVGETLALTESSTRVPNEPQCEQPTEKPNRSQWLQLGYRNDLGDDISRQPGNSDDSDKKAPSPSFDGASVADWTYRRSSRCLHVTHKVARGKACNRPLPIGCPQLSQLP